MNHEDRVVVIEHENDLKMATTSPTTPNDPLVVLDFPWEWAATFPDGVFRFPGGDTVIKHVLSIPIIPSEFHLQPSILLYNKTKGCLAWIWCGAQTWLSSSINHTISRGNGWQRIFRDERDDGRFFEGLEATVDMGGFRK